MMKVSLISSRSLAHFLKTLFTVRKAHCIMGRVVSLTLLFFISRLQVSVVRNLDYRGQ